MIGFFFMHRKFESWQWYKKANIKLVFLHCVMKASYEHDSWQGIELKPGQLISTVKALAYEVATDITEKQVRTALDRLQESGEITCEALPSKKGTLITINKWQWYQKELPDILKRRANGQTDWQANGQQNSLQDIQQQGKREPAANCDASEMRGEQKGTHVVTKKASEMASQRANEQATTKEKNKEKNPPPIAPPQAFSEQTLSNLQSCGFSSSEIQNITSSHSEEKVCGIFDLMRKQGEKIHNPSAYFMTLLENNGLEKDKGFNEFLSSNANEPEKERKTPPPPDDERLNSFSSQLHRHLEEICGESIYQSWFVGLKLLMRNSDEIVLSAKSRFICDYLNGEYRHYVDKLGLRWKAHIKVVYEAQKSDAAKIA